MKKILVVGSVNMDLVMRMEHVPVAGESFIGDSYSFIPGGKGANQAVGAARMGADTWFLGCVGNDANGEALRKNLEVCGVRTDMLAVTEAAPSGMAPILLENNGANRIIVYPGANSHITEEQLEAAFRESWDAVIIQFEIPESIVISAVNMAYAKGVPVVLDAGPAMNFPLEKLNGLCVISPNETETKALTGIEVTDEASMQAASEALLARVHCEAVALKIGARGTYIYKDGVGEVIPSIKISPVDTTAAGDSFTGALTCMLAEGAELREAATWAVCAGALAATKLGAQPSLPTRDEVAAFRRANGR